jgi:hypothetical protein
VAARAKAWSVFDRSNAEIVGSNPAGGMAVCVCSVCVSALFKKHLLQWNGSYLETSTKSDCHIYKSRSQWLHGLRDELSSPAPTLRWWVRIPLEAWLFVCVLCAFILCLPRVEASKNTSTVITASRKRRQKGNWISLSWDSASRPKKRLMRTYHWISFFKSYIETAN